MQRGRERGGIKWKIGIGIHIRLAKEYIQVFPLEKNSNELFAQSNTLSCVNEIASEKLLYITGSSAQCSEVI